MGSYYCSSGDSCPVGQTRYYRQNGCCNTPSDDECGLASFNSFGRVLHGREAMRKQWPWMVLIRYRMTPTDQQKLCGGTLISANRVLTAAHCVSPVQNVYETCAECLQLYMGIHDYTLPFSMEPHRELLIVRRLIIHAEFESVGNWNDIALVEVEDVNIRLSDYIKPICLPQSESPVTGSNCFVAGWGKTEDGMPGTLQEGSVKVGDLSTCKLTYDDLPTVSKVRMEHHICGGEHSSSPDNTTDTCQGDSGGPLMCQRCSTCNWYIAGIVSFGLPRCGLTYGVYTSVTKYENWIRSATRIKSKEPSPCHNCCQYLTIDGGELQTSKQGLYKLESAKHAGHHVYKQLITDVKLVGSKLNYLWFLGGKYNIWFVNRAVGVDKNGGILSSQGRPCPDLPMTWRVYNQTADNWNVSDDIRVNCVDETKLEWSDWTNWQQCGQGDLNKRITRERTCPYNGMCVGADIESKICPQPLSVNTHCCEAFTVLNSENDNIDGTYVANHTINDNPVFLNKDTDYVIYYVSDFRLWVVNSNVNAINANAYAVGSSDPDMCPNQFSHWKVYKNDKWADASSILLNCVAKSETWSRCDCETRMEVQSDGVDITDSRKCTHFERDCSEEESWGEWTRCVGKRFECDFPREQKRFRSCFPTCSQSSLQTESRSCVSESCSTCCPELISTVPIGIYHDNRRLTYRMLPRSGKTVQLHPAYQGYDADGMVQDKYIVFAYGLYWVHSDNLSGEGNVAMYRTGASLCPDQDTSFWNYFSRTARWVTSSDIGLYCSITMP